MRHRERRRHDPRDAQRPPLQQMVRGGWVDAWGANGWGVDTNTNRRSAQQQHAPTRTAAPINRGANSFLSEPDQTTPIVLPPAPALPEAVG